MKTSKKTGSKARKKKKEVKEYKIESLSLNMTFADPIFYNGKEIPCQVMVIE